MNTSDFGSELAQLGLPAALDAKALAAKALSKNRGRIRLLAALTILLWVLDFLMIPAIWLPFVAQMKERALRLIDTNGQVIPVTTEELTRTLADLMIHVSMVSGAILCVMTLASLLAAICTVWLVLTVRRVTLEQLSAGLAQISEQLRRLESMGAK